MQPLMHSALYRGSLRHRRFAPRAHGFRYALFFMYLDLAELDRVFLGRWLWSTQRRALARFDRSDHFGDPARPLDDSVRDLVLRETGRWPAGPIRLLTHLRYLGYCFNPISVYYCFDATDTRVETVVAEVTNTPWNERTCYVLPVAASAADTKVLRFTTGKTMHVSPFMPMELGYDWAFSAPGERLNVHMGVSEHGRKIFDATLTLRRAPVTGLELAKALVQCPLMTAKVIGAIHWEALKLWLKRVPVHTHPAKKHRLGADASEARRA